MTKAYFWQIVIFIALAIVTGFVLGRVATAKEFLDGACKYSTSEFTYYIYPCSEFTKLSK